MHWHGTTRKTHGRMLLPCARAAVTDADLRWAHQSEGVPRFFPFVPCPNQSSLLLAVGLSKHAKVRHGLCFSTRRSLGDTAALVLKLPFFEGMALSWSS